MPDAGAFATIDKPALLVAASESPFVQREMTEAMADALPDARTALSAAAISSIRPPHEEGTALPVQLHR
jgi:hypothetical protein